MLNIVRLSQSTLLHLMESLSIADLNGRRPRMCTGTDENGTWVKWDVGAGWTPPYYSQDV